MNKKLQENQLLPLEAVKNISDIEKQVASGLTIMDALQSIGIKEATFNNGAYFKSDKAKRVIAGEGIMVAETETDTIIRFPKPDVSTDDIITAKEFKPTQNMIGGDNKRNKKK